MHPAQADYPQAMIVVDEILRILSQEPEVIMDFLNMPANLVMVSSEFDTIYQRWIEEEE